MALDNSVKEEIVKKYGKTDKDCGSSEVQIALLTDHFSNNSKDVHSKRGLLKMVMKRRSLIKYLKKTDITSYENLIKQLGLRK